MRQICFLQINILKNLLKFDWQSCIEFFFVVCFALEIKSISYRMKSLPLFSILLYIIDTRQIKMKNIIISFILNFTSHLTDISLLNHDISALLKKDSYLLSMIMFSFCCILILLRNWYKKQNNHHTKQWTNWSWYYSSTNNNLHYSKLK